MLALAHGTSVIKFYHLFTLQAELEWHLLSEYIALHRLMLARHISLSDINTDCEVGFLTKN